MKGAPTRVRSAARIEGAARRIAADLARIAPRGRTAGEVAGYVATNLNAHEVTHQPCRRRGEAARFHRLDSRAASRYDRFHELVRHRFTRGTDHVHGHFQALLSCIEVNMLRALIVMAGLFVLAAVAN
jgi:hypothetical protein